MMKPTIHVDEFAAKMGDDDDIIVLSFFVRDLSAAKDLVGWFEKGYDFVLMPIVHLVKSSPAVIWCILNCVVVDQRHSMCKPCWMICQH
jgi:hypothetical protein